MAYTLLDFLSTQEGCSAVQLAGPTNLFRISIKAVSVQELPVDGFIRKDELVLSTASGCLDNSEAFQKLICDVKSGGAAALFLSFKDPYDKVNCSVLQKAEKLQLPLFIIPWEVRFSDIINGVNQALQNEKLKVYQNLQTELFNAYFESTPIEKTAEMIFKAFGNGVRIFRSDFTILSQAGPLPELEPFSEHTAESPDTMTLEICVADQTYGYLSLYDKYDNCSEAKRGRYDEWKLLMGKYVCFPLSLWFFQKNAETLAIMRLKNDFVWDLAHSAGTEREKLLLQGKRLRFDLDRPYACVLLKIFPPEQMPEYASVNTHVSAQIENDLIQAGKKNRIDIMVSGRNLDFILYLALPKLEPETIVEQFLDQQHDRLKQKFQDYSFFWGISEISLRKPDFPGLYQDAELALQYCVRQRSSQYRFTFRDTKEAQIISALSSNPKIRKIAEDLLQPLMMHGSTSGANLLHTLATFIQCNYNTSLTARTLHIHRQSLLYRLDKIRNLTGLSLNNHQDLFLLDVSMRLLSLYLA